MHFPSSHSHSHSYSYHIIIIYLYHIISLSHTLFFHTFTSMFTLTFIFTFSRFRFTHYSLVFLFFLFSAASSAPSDADFLLKFKHSLQSNAPVLPAWNLSNAPCTARRPNWPGVLCNRAGRVWGIKLENMALRGLIDIPSLRNLPHLRTVSFMKNEFDGPLPDIGQLGSLKALYLSDNRFSGAVESAVFLRMLSLKKVHLARNQFEGQIPVSLTLLPKLIELRLEGNRFDGLVPNFVPRHWLAFDVSNNALSGPIPSGLRTMHATSFHGNKGLCGEPLKACSAHKQSLLNILVLGVVVLMALFAIGAMILVLCPFPCQWLRPAVPVEEMPTEQRGMSAMPPPSPAPSPGGAKLWFVRDDRERFEMAELLSASAEMLGSGGLGSSYKAALPGGGLRPVTVVVKRFKQMNNVGRDEFQAHMRRLGALRHPNVLPLLAFYYKRDEKLLVSDFVDTGSLALHLRGEGGRAVLDGKTRLSIAKGVARGLKYLHDELPGVMAAHGHLKSSNVLLKEGSLQPLVGDYGLIPVINQESAQQQMTAYTSPEYLLNGRITRKTDVWSLGMLILEMLTGKSPNPAGATPSEGEKDLSFDRGLVERSDTATLAMLEKLLRIGKECSEADVERRLDMKEALHKIENLRDPRDEVFRSASDLEDFHSSELEIRPAASDHEIRPVLSNNT